MANAADKIDALRLISNMLITRGGGPNGRYQKYVDRFGRNIQRFGVNPNNPNGIAIRDHIDRNAGTNILNNFYWPSPIQIWDLFVNNNATDILCYNIIQNIKKDISLLVVDNNLVNIIRHQVSQLPNDAPTNTRNRIQAVYPALAAGAVVPAAQTVGDLVEIDSVLDNIPAAPDALLPRSQEAPYFPTIPAGRNLFTVNATARYGQFSPRQSMRNNDYLNRQINEILQAMNGNGANPPLIDNIANNNPLNNLRPFVEVASRNNLRTVLNRIIIKNNHNNYTSLQQSQIITNLYTIENNLGAAYKTILDNIRTAAHNAAYVPIPGRPLKISSIVLHQSNAQTHFVHSSGRCSSNYSNFAQRINFYLSKPRAGVPNPDAGNPTRQDIRNALTLIMNCIESRIIDLLRPEYLVDDAGFYTADVQEHLEPIQFMQRLGVFIASYYTRVFGSPAVVAPPAVDGYNPTGLHISFRYNYNHHANPRSSNYRYYIRLFAPLTIAGVNRTIFQIYEASNTANPIAGGKRKSRKYKQRKSRKQRKNRKTTRRQRK